MDRSEEVLSAARRAYELGRLRLGVRTAMWVAPMVFASLAGCGRASASIVLGVLLGVTVCALVWRGRGAERAARSGLVAGCVALAGPLLACRAVEAAGASGSLAMASCVAGGLAAGAVVTRYARRERADRLSFVLAGGAVAALGGALGCASAGVGGMLAMMAGLALVAPVGLRALPVP